MSTFVPPSWYSPYTKYDAAENARDASRKIPLPLMTAFGINAALAFIVRYNDLLRRLS